MTREGMAEAETDRETAVALPSSSNQFFSSQRHRELEHPLDALRGTVPQPLRGEKWASASAGDICVLIVLKVAV